MVVACRTQSWRLMHHAKVVLHHVDWVKLLLIVGAQCRLVEISDMVAVCAHEELFLLFTVLLDCHISVFVLGNLSMRHCMAKALRVPVLCIVLPIICLSTWRHRKKQWSLSWACIQCLQLVLSINIQTLVCLWVAVFQINMLSAFANLCLSLTWHHLLRSYVWWTLLIALVAREWLCLMHIHRSIEMLQAAMLHVMIVLDSLSLHIYIEFHLRIAAVVDDLLLVICHVLGQESAFVKICALLHIHVLLSAWIEFDHHCAIEFWASGVHCSGIDVVKSHHASLGVALRWLGGVLGHLDHVLILTGLIVCLALHLLIILLLATEGQLGTLVELICIALSRNIHHH